RPDAAAQSADPPSGTCRWRRVAFLGIQAGSNQFGRLGGGAEEPAERNGDELCRYPLRGGVVRYEQPTQPIAEAECKAPAWAQVRDPYGGSFDCPSHSGAELVARDPDGALREG